MEPYEFLNPKERQTVNKVCLQFSANNLYSCLLHAVWAEASSLDATRVQPGRAERSWGILPACPWTVSCQGGRGWRHLRHITGSLIKTHVRQSDRHGKTVWKKLLGIKYIVTTWFQRFINKLTDHLVSIRSDRSTNPGISALGLVGGGRRWLSMRGDIEGKSPCRFQGGPLLTLFQRGSMHVQTSFTPPVFQSLWDWESGWVTQKQRSYMLTFCEKNKDLLRLLFSLLALTVQ